MEIAAARIVKHIVIDQIVRCRIAAKSAYFQRPGLSADSHIASQRVITRGRLKCRLIHRRELADSLDEVPLHQVMLAAIRADPSLSPSAVHHVIQPAVVPATRLTEAFVVTAARQMVAPDGILRAAQHRQHKPTAPIRILGGIRTPIIVQIGAVDQIVLSADHHAKFEGRNHRRTNFHVEQRVVAAADLHIVFAVWRAR